MKFKKAFYKPGTPDTYTVIFDPWNDFYSMSHNVDSSEEYCKYHGMQCDENVQGDPIAFDYLPEGIKNKYITLKKVHRVE